MKSGNKARQAYANQEAVTFYTQAIEVRGRITHPLEDMQLLLVYQEQLRVLQRMGDPTPHLDGLRIEGNGFLVGIRLPGFIPRLHQIVKGFLPDCPPSVK